tara:strand:+ start:143 stop:382 length:240 start_codon:yes stop_codon:yes gene_type:complete
MTSKISEEEWNKLIQERDKLKFQVFTKNNELTKLTKEFKNISKIIIDNCPNHEYFRDISEYNETHYICRNCGNHTLKYF